MICPTDMVQMRQVVLADQPIGGGVANDATYTTWEVKECPICERMVLEFYEASVFTSVKEALEYAEIAQERASNREIAADL